VAPADLQDIHMLVRDLPRDRAVATFYTAQVRQHLGVQIAMEVMPSVKVSQKLGSGDFQLQGPGGWIADYPDQQDWFDSFLSASYGRQWSRYSNPAFDRLVGEADTTSDLARRAQLYRQAQQLLVQDAPVAFLYQPQVVALRQAYVQKAVESPLDEWPGGLNAASIQLLAH
jgi:ABC-type oligopeptide transport system substrate-binding subunit